MATIRGKGYEVLVKNRQTHKTCGRDTANDLVLERPGVSRVHASIKLAQDGFIWVLDHSSGNGTFLQRCDTWLRVEKTMLCAGDRIRFADCEVPLEQLTGLFGAAQRVRLGERQFAKPTRQIPAAMRDKLRDPGEQFAKPRRNPETGKIEEKPSA